MFQCGPGYHAAWLIETYGNEPITEFLKASGYPATHKPIFDCADPMTLVQLQWAIQFTWIIALTMAKISVLLLYVKVFPLPYTVLAARVSAVVVVLWSTASVVATVLICRPISYSWGGSVEGHCGDQIALYKGIGVVNLLTDIACLALPMRHLWTIQLPRARKNILIFTFALGFL